MDPQSVSARASGTRLPSSSGHHLSHSLGRGVGDALRAPTPSVWGVLRQEQVGTGSCWVPRGGPGRGAIPRLPPGACLPSCCLGPGCVSLAEPVALCPLSSTPVALRRLRGPSAPERASRLVPSSSSLGPAGRASHLLSIQPLSSQPEQPCVRAGLARSGLQEVLRPPKLGRLGEKARGVAGKHLSSGPGTDGSRDPGQVPHLLRLRWFHL